MRLVAEIEIQAPPERIWEILTDFGAYPQWNPFMPRLDGEARGGAAADAAGGVRRADPAAAPARHARRAWPRAALGRWRPAGPRRADDDAAAAGIGRRA